MIVQHGPRESALARAVGEEEAVWSLTDHLLAVVIDVLNIGNWQRENEGRPKGKSPTRKPKRIPRPGVEDERKTVGSEPIPIKDFEAWWDAGVVDAPVEPEVEVEINRVGDSVRTTRTRKAGVTGG